MIFTEAILLLRWMVPTDNAGAMSSKITCIGYQRQTIEQAT